MNTIENKIWRIYIIIFLFAFNWQTTFAINKNNSDFRQLASITEVKGAVIDANTKKPLVFATINLLETNISTVTNTEGNFVLKIPAEVKNGKISISYLGYESKTVLLTELSKAFNTIALNESTVDLQEVSLLTLKDASKLVKDVFQNKDNNYLKDPTLMTAFYRESIKKRNKNVSLSEAVVNIYKTPYTSNNRDNIKIFKARKSTNYKKLDTVAFKLQGGPFNSLFLDVIKYPKYLFDQDFTSYYDFSFDRTTEINNQAIYVIKFKEKNGVDKTLYKGELYIEPKNKILVSAIYSLDIKNAKDASRIFVKRKPKNASVYPKEIIYRVDYKESGGKWYYSYGNAMLKFKINWNKKLFNSTYTMNCEMAVTDWKKNISIEKPNRKELIKSSIILSDQASGFYDSNFWGENNIIEPEKNIESAIKKIRKQLRKSESKQNTFAAL